MKKLLSSIKVMLPALICLALYSLSAPAEDEKWHTKPLTYETLGADVNNYYRVVGLPKDCICQFMAGQPAYSEHGHDFFYVSGHPKMFVEIEYSDDGQTIRRFRFIEKSPSTLTENKYGGWQIKDVRQRANEFKTGISILQLDTAKDPFAMPFATMAFTSKTWRSDLQHRIWFLFDIVHDYPIIGMNHSALIAILGTADYIPNVPPDATSDFDYVDKYTLSGGCLGIYSDLEIAYRDDKAVAFRVGSPKKNTEVMEKLP